MSALNEVTEEFRVVWFPPGSKDRARSFPTLAAAEAFAADTAAGCAPLIERRTITVGPWETVANPEAPR